MTSFEPTEILASLPHQPGVYRMIGAAGDVLYVGKARDLKQRVSSYFRAQAGLSPRIQLMVAQIHALETTVTRSEGEALLLENNLIKSLRPRYNIVFRDDKSYPYLMLSGHAYPRLGSYRGSLDSRNQYFGPFPHAGAVRESMQLLQKVFRLRTCADSVFNNRNRPCLQHQIHRCTAPCVEKISAVEYAADVRGAALFLKGKDGEAVERLAERMNAAAAEQNFEAAAVLRDQIAALGRVRETQFVSGHNGRDADVIGCALAGEIVCVNLVMIRGGHHLGDRNFFPQNAAGFPAEQIIEAFIGQHYAERDSPPALIVGAALGEESIEYLEASLSAGQVRIATNPGGERRVWLEMAVKNAELAAQRQLGLRATQEARLQALQMALDANENLQRIECFDISHTMGEATVASCVVYDKSAMQNGEYRRFNICGITPGDDYGAMQQALTRRYQRIIAEEGKLPDLLLIDGGKGQVGVAREVLGELGLQDLSVVGVAKGEARKPGLEQLIIQGRGEALQLSSEHPALHLIQQIRDEAHRFAIQGHRARRGKTRNTSTLEEISGVGAKRRQKLLTRFGGLQGLMAASIDDIAQVDGISGEIAKRIYETLH